MDLRLMLLHKTVEALGALHEKKENNYCVWNLQVLCLINSKEVKTFRMTIYSQPFPKGI